MRSYDVIIVGAGPAGATLGYELAKREIETLILEGKELPRYKACAGGITVRAAKLLDFDIAPVVEQTITGIRITYKLGKGCLRQYDKPIVYMVMRDKFDYLLVQKAQDAGAEVCAGQKVNRIQTASDWAIASTPTGEFKGRIIVGADGTNGIVARSLGLMRDIEPGMAIAAEVFVADGVLERWSAIATVDFGSVRGGYGWVFPKGDHLSIGVGGPIQVVRNLKPCYERLLSSLDLGGYKVSKFSGHPVPVCRAKMAIQRGNALLLGDAAGLVHSLIGEGVYYAIRSAQLAAPVIAEALRAESINLYDYEQAVNRELMPGLRRGRALSRLHYRSPYLYFHLFKRSERLWRVVCCLLRGEEGGVKQELGPALPLFKLLHLGLKGVDNALSWSGIR